MSIFCKNPEVFQGDPSGPPEYASNDSQPCSNCWYEIDMDDERFTRMADGTLLCSECREACDNCGEFVTDPARIIHMRCYATGRRESYCNGDCAGMEFLGRMLECVSTRQKDAQISHDISRMDPETMTLSQIELLHYFYSKVKA